MTREEEISQMAKSYTQVIFGSLDDFSDITDAYIDGAKWADETMIEKACEWIKENIDTYAKVVISPKSHYPEIVMCDTFEKNFKKAMEE